MIPQIIGGILRTILAAVGGKYVAEGWLDDDQLQQIIGAILTLAVMAWSIWAKARKRTVPGGEFNPQADVRKATPVSGARGLSRRGGVNKGCISRALVVSLAFFWFIAFCAAGGFSVQRYEPLPCPGADYSTHLRMIQIEDKRPFLARLLDSLRFSVTPKLSQDKESGRLGAAIAKVEIKGGATF